jgi:hypothetical protein
MISSCKDFVYFCPDSRTDHFLSCGSELKTSAAAPSDNTAILFAVPHIYNSNAIPQIVA